MRFPRKRLVARFYDAQNVFNILLGAMITVASFTFAAQYRYAPGETQQGTVAPRPFDPDHPDTDADTAHLNRVAATAIVRALAALPPADVRAYAELVRASDDHVRWTRQAKVWRKLFERLRGDDGPQIDPPKASPPAAAPAPNAPVTAKTKLGLTKMFAALVSEFIPIPDTLAGRFFGEQVNSLSEYLADRGLKAAARADPEATVAKVADWLKPRLAGLRRRAAAAGGMDALVDDLHRTVAQEEAAKFALEHPPVSPGRRIIEDRLHGAQDSEREK